MVSKFDQNDRLMIAHTDQIDTSSYLKKLKKKQHTKTVRYVPPRHNVRSLGLNSKDL